MASRSQNHSYSVHGQDASGYAGYDLRCSPTSLSTAGTLTVTLLDYEGTPVQGVAIAATSSNLSAATVTASDTTDASGEATFTVSDAGSGAFNITFHYPGCGRQSVGLIPGTMP